VPFPDVIAPDVRWHLACFAQDGDDGLVFTSPAGAPLRHSNFYRRVWVKALERVGMTGVHFHDLRHTGNMLTADAGANLRELVDRMGHASSCAAMIYLHSTDVRQRSLADAVGKLARAQMRKTEPHAAAAKHLARKWHGAGECLVTALAFHRRGRWPGDLMGAQP
jgi:Phage integrase family